MYDDSSKFSKFQPNSVLFAILPDNFLFEFQLVHQCVVWQRGPRRWHTHITYELREGGF